jgi:hypothetical protein
MYIFHVVSIFSSVVGFPVRIPTVANQFFTLAANKQKPTTIVFLLSLFVCPRIWFVVYLWVYGVDDWITSLASLNCCSHGVWLAEGGRQCSGCSYPSSASGACLFSSVVEHWTLKLKVPGSNPNSGNSVCYILSVLRITAVFISCHLGPVIPTSAILKKGSPHQVSYLPLVWDCLLALAHTLRYKESRFYVSFKGRSNHHVTSSVNRVYDVIVDCSRE